MLIIQPYSLAFFRSLLVTDSQHELGSSEREGRLAPEFIGRLAVIPQNQVVPVGTADRYGPVVAVRTPLKGMPLSLVTVAAQDSLYGHTVSDGFLAVLVVFPFVVLVSGLVIRDQQQRVSRFRSQAHNALEALNRDLERLVAERTRDLGEANRQLKIEISVRQRAERAIQDRMNFIEGLLEVIPAPVFYKDEHLRYTGCNKAFETFFGIKNEDLIGRTSDEIWMGKYAETFSKADEALFASGGHQIYETLIETRDGRQNHIELYKTLLRKADQSYGGIVGVVWDVTERNRAADEIRFLAHHDPLTKLPNRLLGRDRMERAMALATRTQAKVAMVYLDLDHFKTINDTLSHAVGDTLLQDVAARLQNAVRDGDTVSRLGGDEFLSVLPALSNPNVAAAIAERMMESMAEPFMIEGRELTISASIGIALYPDDGDDFDILLRKADLAMYQAKEAGRNHFRFFDSRIHVPAIEQLSLRNDLRTALNNGEFVLHYQPKIDLITGATLGAEALIRWHHPILKELMPGRFIPLAEASGIIVTIGDWVLREACRQAVAWQRHGEPGIAVAVNLSAVQFKRGNVDRAVAAALSDTDLNPALLELELTESVLISDTEAILSQIQQLKALGVTISIDDFGTGYSSLAYLKRLAVDKVKIDKTFVGNMCSDSENAAIVRAIIQMALSLNLGTIAEGVEDSATLNHLRTLNCDAAQGYYFARPMPAKAFLNFIANRRPARSA